MPLYEFILRVTGRPDELRISDSNGFCEGDEIRIASRRWTVAAIKRSTTTRPDHLRVEQQIVVVPAGDRPE